MRASGEEGHARFYEYLRLRIPLEVDMVVVSPSRLRAYCCSDRLMDPKTVEPGIYLHQHLLAPVRESEFVDQEVLARYEPVGGVRIEDGRLARA